MDKENPRDRTITCGSCGGTYPKGWSHKCGVSFSRKRAKITTPHSTRDHSIPATELGHAEIRGFRTMDEVVENMLNNKPKITFSHPIKSPRRKIVTPKSLGRDKLLKIGESPPPESPLYEIAVLLLSARADILQNNPAAASSSIAVALDEIAKLEDAELRK